MAYQIPLFKLNFDEKEALAAADTIRSGWISTGPKCEELEHIFVDMFHVSYAVAISNCTDALHLCCLVCGIGPGDEVLCPSLTFARLRTVYVMLVPPLFFATLSALNISILIR